MGRHEKASPWARTASFAMGLLSQADWSGARWIAFRTRHRQPDGDRRTGTSPAGDRPLQTAANAARISGEQAGAPRDDVCGLGQFELFLNGTKTGDHFLDPAWTKFDKEAQYVSFDVTDRLKQGKNAVGVMLGNGFFNIPNERYTKFVGSYGAPKMLLKMEIEYEDGTSDTIVSDASWKTTQSPITFRASTAARISMRTSCSKVGKRPDSTTADGRMRFSRNSTARCARSVPRR